MTIKGTYADLCKRDDVAGKLFKNVTLGSSWREEWVMFTDHNDKALHRDSGAAIFLYRPTGEDIIFTSIPQGCVLANPEFYGSSSEPVFEEVSENIRLFVVLK